MTCPGCGRAADPAAGPLNFCPDCGAALAAGPGFDAGGSGTFLGKVIAERYRLLALLGEGGMGAVYKAEHVRMGKALAVKVLRGAFAREPGAAERFRAEARIVSRLSHPHTIAVFDFGEIDDGSGFYLAMEYVPGKDLAAVLRDAGRLPERRVAEIGRQVLGSLAEAHDAGIVHRDVKPGNVMLMQTRSGDDFVKVLDFGIAKLRDEASQASQASAATGAAIVGTPSALAPEQARGGPVDGRADLYAVGCLLHELASGRPPFEARSPMAVISAHLHQAPPSLAEHAPGTSRRLAEVVLRALAKRPEDRYASADEMRDALLGVGEEGAGAPRRARPGTPQVTGALQIARREDFQDFERQVRALRRSRVLPPLLAALLVLAAGAGAWRWPDLYALLAARAPALAARVPEPLRPPARADGAEQEPNDLPARANPLVLPPGPDGREGGGVAAVRGHVGARLSARTGDVDVFRLEVPPAEGRRVLVATWRGEREGEGIRGLDVALTLNRAPAGDGAAAPLLATADRGGPGRPERLVAAVEAGTHYLAVRERHAEAEGPVEKPTDAYLLEVRLAAPEPGAEVEPNDAPERAAGADRYPRWRALGERNPLAAGEPVHGETSGEDPDVYAVAAGPALLAAVPAAGLALAARRWVPDAEDLAPRRTQDRVRLEPGGEGAPGAVLLVPLPPAPAPALVELRAAAGEGAYDVVALGEGSAEAVLGLVRALAGAGRLAPALELAAGFADGVPRAAGRDEVLLAAGRLAEEAARGLAPDAVGAFDRAAQLLGDALFEVADGTVRYRGAFEGAAKGNGPAAEEAALRRVALAAPCTPDDVIARAAAFLARKPAPTPPLAAEARILRARALEDLFWATGGADRARRDAALAAWRAVGAAGDAPAGEAVLRTAALGAKEPSREGARPVCP